MHRGLAISVFKPNYYSPCLTLTTIFSAQPEYFFNNAV